MLLLAAAPGLMLSAVFPTDPAPGVGSIGGEIHRWSAAVVFTTLPWPAGCSAAAPANRAAVGRQRVLSVVFLAGFLAAHPASFTSDLIGGAAYYGLLERALVLAEITLIFLAARGWAVEPRERGPAPRRRGREEAGERGPRPADRPEPTVSAPRATVPAQPSEDDTRRPREPIGLGSA